MNDIMKQYRDLLKENKRKPFEKWAHTKISTNLLDLRGDAGRSFVRLKVM